MNRYSTQLCCLLSCWCDTKWDAYGIDWVNYRGGEPKYFETGMHRF